MKYLGLALLAILAAPTSADAGEVGANVSQSAKTDTPWEIAIEETGASATRLTEQAITDTLVQRNNAGTQTEDTIDAYIADASEALSLEMQKRILDNLQHIWTSQAVVLR